jgi:hypothetical protein
MTLVQNNFNGGTDGNGTTGQITTANSANSGDAFNTMTPTPPTATWTYDATGALAGLGARVQIASSTAWRAYHQWTSTPQLAGRVVFTFNTLPSAAIGITSIINATSFANIFACSIAATNKISFVNAASGSLGATASAISANTPYVAEFQLQPDGTGAAGIVTAQFYAAATPGTQLITVNSTTANLGTVTGIVRGALGQNTAVTSLDITFDAVAYNTGTLTAIGPPSLSPSAAVAASTGVPPSGTADAIAVGMTIRGN